MKGFDTDRTFALVEIAGDELFFQIVSRTGETVDTGMISRQSKQSSTGIREWPQFNLWFETPALGAESLCRRIRSDRGTPFLFMPSRCPSERKHRDLAQRSVSYSRHPRTGNGPGTSSGSGPPDTNARDFKGDYSPITVQERFEWIVKSTVGPKNLARV